MARPRYQRGPLIDDGDRWLARWREDVADDAGAIRRVHKKAVLASKKECPTMQMALSTTTARPATPRRRQVIGHVHSTSRPGSGSPLIVRQPPHGRKGVKRVELHCSARARERFRQMVQTVEFSRESSILETTNDPDRSHAEGYREVMVIVDEIKPCFNAVGLGVSKMKMELGTPNGNSRGPAKPELSKCFLWNNRALTSSTVSPQ